MRSEKGDSAERPSPLSPLAVALSAVSTLVYFFASNGVHNYFRWLADVARKLFH